MASFRELLTIPKEVKATKPRTKTHPGHLRIDLPLHSEFAGLTAFVRQSTALIESFSIGLLYEVTGREPIIILRVNGDHGRHRNPDGTVFSGPHVHEPRDIDLDREPWRGFEPKYARTIDGQYRMLGSAWDLFCQLAAVLPNEPVARHLGRIHTQLAQEVLDGILD